MLRLLGFLFVTVVALQLLRGVPVVGSVFHGFFGFWLAAILMALGAAKLTEVLTLRAKLANSLRALGHVESPHNQGKLGSLLASHGRFARALPHLERAVRGEPEVAEWHYRHGQALLETGAHSQAAEALARAAELDPEHAYGGVQLALARAHARRGAPSAALEALDVFDRNHGPNPESAFRRGELLKASGHAAEADESFRRVGALAAHATKFQRKSYRGWALRAWFARLT
ncbi:MAG: tetratricopeptide repeat protein [Planctomycetes bacterium]|nr:tetratricopeptide repeat protein [Planctomycetota bacterium]